MENWRSAEITLLDEAERVLLASQDEGSDLPRLREAINVVRRVRGLGPLAPLSRPLKLTDAIRIWDYVHGEDVGALCFSDLLAAILGTVGVVNDLAPGRTREVSATLQLDPRESGVWKEKNRMIESLNQQIREMAVRYERRLAENDEEIAILKAEEAGARLRIQELEGLLEEQS